MAYVVALAPAARRGLRNLPANVQRRLAPHIDRLADNPRPRGAVRIVAQPGSVFRIRVGDYRVVYEIHDAEQQVVVTVIGNRKDVYRDL